MESFLFCGENKDSRIGLDGFEHRGKILSFLLDTFVDSCLFHNWLRLLIMGWICDVELEWALPITKPSAQLLSLQDHPSVSYNKTEGPFPLFSLSLRQIIA